MTLPFHPLAELFPLIEGHEFQHLVDDIVVNGLRESIVLHEGAILDGRNRYRALVEIASTGQVRGAGWGAYANEAITSEDLTPDGGQPWFERYSPMLNGDPLSYVISKNLNRRHLNESQRAMVAAKLATMRQGERTDLQPSANLPKVAQPGAAETLKVSERLLRSAKVVQEEAAPEIVRAVEQGKLAVSAAAQAARLAPETQRRIAEQAAAGHANVVRTVIKQETRETRERELGAKQQALPEKKYGVIVADPEWRFEPRSRATGLDRAPDNHYPTSPTDEIAARPVPSIAADDCALFLWATAPMLPDALRVMAAWGFDYKTHAAWLKERAGDAHGPGYWFWGEHELLLLGTRGKIPAPAPGLQWISYFHAPVGRHSAKPDLALQMIETYFPTLPKIELNRRGPARPGWDAWGNETEPASTTDQPETVAPVAIALQPYPEMPEFLRRVET